MKACLVVASGVHQGKSIPIPGSQFVIGRDEACQLRPASPNISNKHCILFLTVDKVTVVDLGSTNGTFVNGERVSGEKNVTSGDLLRVGPLEFFINWRVGAPEPPPAPKRSPGAHRPMKAPPVNVMEAEAAEQAQIPTEIHATTGSQKPIPKTVILPKGGSHSNPGVLKKPASSEGTPKLPISGAKKPTAATPPAAGATPKPPVPQPPKKATHAPLRGPGAASGHANKPPKPPVHQEPPPEPEYYEAAEEETGTEYPVAHDTVTEYAAAEIENAPNGAMLLNLDDDSSQSSVPEGTTVMDLPIVRPEEVEAIRLKSLPKAPEEPKVEEKAEEKKPEEKKPASSMDNSVVAMGILNKYSMLRAKK